MLLRRSGWFVLGALATVGCGGSDRPDVLTWDNDVQFTQIDGGYILPDGRIVYYDTPSTAQDGGSDLGGSTADGGDGGSTPPDGGTGDGGPGIDVVNPPIDAVAGDNGVSPGMDSGVAPDAASPSPDVADVSMEDVERCTPGAMRMCPMAPGQVEQTYRTGRCRRGTQQCGQAGRWEACIGQIEPIEELCNNVDDNCNGLIDDIHQRCGAGACQIERLVCVLGRNIQCEPNRAAMREETCNGFDDDCDGMIDEGDGDAGQLQESCFTYPPEYNGRGTCRSGIRGCERGMWTSCSDVIPQPERCNSLDDDCDGVVDNNCRDD